LELLKMKSLFTHICQTVHSNFLAPRREVVQFLLFGFGISVMSIALSAGTVTAQTGQGLDVTQYAPDANFGRMDNMIGIIMALIEGRFGVLIMLCAGIAAIISSAFGQYRAALSLLVVALGAFILRTLVTVFFNTQGIGQDGGGDVFGQ
jgi:hypothetical protein